MILYDEKTNAFLLGGKNYSYAMYVNDAGFLQNLHYGGKITPEDLPFLISAFGESKAPKKENINMDMSVDGMPGECGFFGHGDYREPTVLIRRADGVRLHALYAAAPHPTDRTAVIVHGYTDNAVRMLMIGYLYNHDLGYNILLPDLYYHGRSEGRAIQMGWKDRLDVLRWMQIADSLFGGHTRQVVHGISMGAATTMMLSGEELPPYVKCFVEDCGYTSVRDQFTKELRGQFGLPAFPLLDVASWLCGLKYGWTFGEASALKQVARCDRPMLFIHGDADDYVPTAMVYPLYEAKPGEKELWVVPGAAHALSYRDNRAEYTRRVGEFVGRYIPEERN